MYTELINTVEIRLNNFIIKSLTNIIYMLNNIHELYIEYTLESVCVAYFIRVVTLVRNAKILFIVDIFYKAINDEKHNLEICTSVVTLTKTLKPGFIDEA